MKLSNYMFIILILNVLVFNVVSESFSKSTISKIKKVMNNSKKSFKYKSAIKCRNLLARKSSKSKLKSQIPRL